MPKNELETHLQSENERERETGQRGRALFIYLTYSIAF